MRGTLVALRIVVGLVASSAFVAIWGGWVGLGKLAGFGPVDLLPGFGTEDDPLLMVDLSITLPLGIEAYAAIALYIAVSGLVAGWARAFAWCSAIAALAVGAFGQAAYHLLTVGKDPAAAPTPVVIFVSVLPVAVLGMASVLLHLAERGAAAATAAAPAREDADLAEEPADGGGDDDPNGDGGWAPWGPDDDPGSDEFWQAISAADQAVVSDPGSRLTESGAPGSSAPRSLLSADLRVEELPSDRRRVAAHQILAELVAPSRDRLSERHGMSPRWWGDRIAERRGRRSAG